MLGQETRDLGAMIDQQGYRPILNSDGSKIRLFEFTARERENR